MNDPFEPAPEHFHMPETERIESLQLALFEITESVGELFRPFLNTERWQADRSEDFERIMNMLRSAHAKALATLAEKSCCQADGAYSL